MNESMVLEQRRQARAAKYLADSALLDLHRKAANALLAPGEGAHVRERALQQVEKWQRQHLCNPRYVQAWRNILDLPAASIPAAMLREDAEGIALRQNSPFGFLVNRAA